MILKEILEVKGYKARTIQLIRQLGNSHDTHVVTEVYNKQYEKYILLDPTFNLMFKLNEKYINANEVRQSVLYDKNNINIIRNIHQNVEDYTKYYVDYLSLYNNVLIVKTNNSVGYKRLLLKLPIFHNFHGGKYFVNNNDSTKAISLLYNLYYIFVPIFFVANIFVIIYMLIIKRKKEKICVE